ncbi:lysylphosphatidylglycerol synthase domain-containing protein [Alsobacter sp. SYSU M60028]|uniref:Lysylphosphatidylglycerol synthase domain-containing protein n=1 Tax=Alsobacter ponti TaxID=2962936 RepID=A0ABT1LG35_9HYPH|nr:lysylphosphatidylglycerol synthase domain-containing protein [Alsobacter ponti]
MLLFAASLAVLYIILSQVDPAEIRAAFRSATGAQLAMAGMLTAASYALLSGYDLLALRQLRARMRYRIVALGSFTSYAISFTLGFPPLTAGTVRYWIYAPRGLSAGKVASLTLIAGVTFILGMATVLSAALLFRADAMAELNHLAPKLNMLIGGAGLAALAGYLTWVGVERRAIRMQRWRLELPTLPVSLAQLALGIGDMLAASGVLYVLLPPGHGIAFETFAAVYAFAAMLGMASHAPGGVGVFEATFLLAFSRLPYEGLLGSLLLFRVVYYLIPFVLALLLLGAMEIASRLRAYRARIERDATDEQEG